MISELHVENFKSLRDVTVGFERKLNVLIGMNGSGKTTILHCLGFLAWMGAHGWCSEWLALRDWNKDDLLPAFPRRARSPRVPFRLKSTEWSWEGVYNVDTGKCTTERVTGNGDNTPLLELKDGQYRLCPDMRGTLASIKYEGSILRFLMTDKTKPTWNDLDSVRSMDLLSPEQMRRSVRRAAADDVGFAGEQLSLFLHGIKGERKEKLEAVMRRFYPEFDSFQTRKIRGGGIKLTVRERTGTAGETTTGTRHLNDGMLRVLAIVADTLFAKGTVLIDEIEDGINPELLEKLIHYILEDCPCQVITTTHSPLLLNFLPDEIAKKGTKFVYKVDGETFVTPFFDIPLTRDKLEMLGPGEVMLQYDMVELLESIKQASDSVCQA